jgi:hypothetical protein
MIEELRKLLPFTTALLVIAALYVGLTFYWRWDSARQLRNRQAVAEAERARVDLERNGGADLKILSLYATPGIVARGQKTQLCYSVANAKSVNFEPEVAEVWPSHGRCVDVAPTHDTTYVLTAKDPAGHTDTAKVKVLVR